VHWKVYMAFKGSSWNYRC